MTGGADTSAARAAYDASAAAYVEWAGGELGPATEAPIDQALLDAFVELARSGPGGPVADLGCGPGRVAAHLARRDLTVLGLDLAPAMVIAARRAHATLPFAAAALDALPIASGALAAAVSWYSIINTPPDSLDAVATELARALRPRGPLLVAFQAGAGERIDRMVPSDPPVALTTYRHAPDHVVDRLVAAGFDLRARVRREAELPHETSPQAFLFATAPA